MNIVADANIPFVEEAFASFGNVKTISGYDISRDDLLDCSMLLVRSVTQVGEALLSDTPVKFVASATIGREHVDESWLSSRGIGFASAPGANSLSVVEYVLSALYSFEKDLRGKSLAIVGVGSIGSLLYEKAKHLGMNITLYDPPLAKNLFTFLPLKEALAEADFVSLHVPLTYDGDSPTYGMVNESFLSLMKKGAVLINSSRGKTIVEEALIAHAPNLGGLVLDVWPDEPDISPELLDIVDIATPHIAGYSYEGKCRGTEIISSAATDFFFKGESWSAKAVLDSIPPIEIVYNIETGISGVISKAYSIEKDSDILKKRLRASGFSRKEFQELRKNYPKRMQFSHCRVDGVVKKDDKKILKLLGFQISEELS